MFDVHYSRSEPVATQACDRKMGFKVAFYELYILGQKVFVRFAPRSSGKDLYTDGNLITAEHPPSCPAFLWPCVWDNCLAVDGELSPKL